MLVALEVSVQAVSHIGSGLFCFLNLIMTQQFLDARRRGDWFCNRESCNTFYGECSYRRYCKSNYDEAVRKEMFEVAVSPHAEFESFGTPDEGVQQAEAPPTVRRMDHWIRPKDMVMGERHYHEDLLLMMLE